MEVKDAKVLSTQDLRAPGKLAATLGYSAYADILASTISTLDTPANVGIFAGWGSGKSHLLDKIRDVLHERSERYPTTKGKLLKCIKMLWYLVFFNLPQALKRSNEVRFISAYFNALEYAGSDHLWAGLVTRLVGAVELGIGRLPSAIFRAKRPRRMSLRSLTSSNPEKLRFRPKTLCGSKIPVYALFIFIIIASVVAGVSLLAYALDTQAKLMKENDRSNASTTASSLLDTHVKKSSMALGAIIISIPLVAFLKDVIPVVAKVINTHKAHIEKMLSRPDFSKELGVMAKIKEEIRHLSRLVRFMELFEQRRIVIAIFIDDLDKLPQQNIAPLLQAIKILLSDPTSRFVSIIAIDPYSVSDALEMGIQSEFPAINMSGHKFLKQMIQVPFSIPAMNCEEKAHLFRVLEKRDRLSKSEVTLNIVAEDEVDGQMHKPATSLDTVEHEKAPGEMVPLLNHKSALSSDGKFDEIIQMDTLNDDMADQPLDRHDGVVSACACVMSELRSPQIFPFVRNNLQEMLRLVGIVKVTTRVIFCRLDHAKVNQESHTGAEEPFGILPRHLAAWVVLVGQWPYRTTWMIQQVEDRDDARSPYSRCTTLLDVYRDSERNFTLVPGWRKLIQLDGDPDDLEIFLYSNESWLNVGFLHKLLPHTISLDRSLKSIVAWTSVERDLKTHGTFTSKPLSHMDVSDVVDLIKSSCKSSKRLDEYASKCTEHNISGPVLLRGDMEEVKKCFQMSLGDWTLFSHALLQLKTVQRYKFST